MNTQKFGWDTANVVFWQIVAVFICAAGLWIVMFSSDPVEIELFSIFFLGVALYMGYWGPVSDLVNYSEEEDSCQDSIRRAKSSFYKRAAVWGLCSYMGWRPLPGYLQRRIQKVSDELEQRKLEGERQAVARHLDYIRRIQEQALERARVGNLDLSLLGDMHSNLSIDNGLAIRVILEAFEGYILQLRRETIEPVSNQSELIRLTLRVVMERFSGELETINVSGIKGSETIGKLMEEYGKRRELACDASDQLYEATRIVNGLIYGSEKVPRLEEAQKNHFEQLLSEALGKVQSAREKIEEAHLVS